MKKVIAYEGVSTLDGEAVKNLHQRLLDSGLKPVDVKPTLIAVLAWVVDVIAETDVDALVTQQHASDLLGDFAKHLADR